MEHQAIIEAFNALDAEWQNDSRDAFAKIQHLIHRLGEGRGSSVDLAFVAWQAARHFPTETESLRQDLALLEPHLSPCFSADKLRRLREILRGKIVFFVSEVPSQREIELAEAANMSGWTVALIYDRPPNYDPSKYFQFSLSVSDPIAVLLLVCSVVPRLLHLFTKGGGIFAYLLCRYKVAPVVFDYYDIVHGINQPWAQQRRGMEKFSLESADAISHRDLRGRYLEKLGRCRLPGRNILVTDLVKQDSQVQIRKPHSSDEIHVVSCGWIGAPNTDSHDNSIYRVVQALVWNGIYVHIYPNPMQFSSNLKLTPLRVYAELAEQTPYFQVHEPVPYDRFFAEMSRYDFGLTVFESFLFHEEFRLYTIDYLEGCGSSRLKSYLEMAMPVIMSPELKYQYFFARRYGYVVPVTQDFMRNPRLALESALRARDQSGPKSMRLLSTRFASRRLGRLYDDLAM